MYPDASLISLQLTDHFLTFQSRDYEIKAGYGKRIELWARLERPSPNDPDLGVRMSWPVPEDRDGRFPDELFHHTWDDGGCIHDIQGIFRHISSFPMSYEGEECTETGPCFSLLEYYEHEPDNPHVYYSTEYSQFYITAYQAPVVGTSCAE
jgi:hypothetical protein